MDSPMDARYLLPGEVAALIADEAIGLFLEDLRRWGYVITDGAGFGENAEYVTGARARSVSEVVQGVEAEL